MDHVSTSRRDLRAASTPKITVGGVPAGKRPACRGFKAKSSTNEPKQGGRSDPGIRLGMMQLSGQHVAEPAWVDAWMSVRDRLRLEVGQGVFDSWIAPLSLIAAAEGVVRLSSPSRLVRDYTTSHHGERIEQAFAATIPGFCAMEIVVAATDGRALTTRSTPQIAAAKALSVPNAQPMGANHLPGASLQGIWDRVADPGQTFASFVVGPSNEFAYKPAQRVAERKPSPLRLLVI